jgi:hypothetical protein
VTAVDYALFAVLVFTAASLMDIAYARYTVAATARRPATAAAWSVAVYLVGLVGLFSVLERSVWLVIPEVLGLACGTYLGVRQGRRVGVGGVTEA